MELSTFLQTASESIIILYIVFQIIGIIATILVVFAAEMFKNTEREISKGERGISKNDVDNIDKMQGIIEKTNINQLWRVIYNGSITFIIVVLALMLDKTFLVIIEIVSLILISILYSVTREIPEYIKRMRRNAVKFNLKG
jgi:glycerol uptake facilitator-like aquaporin